MRTSLSIPCWIAPYIDVEFAEVGRAEVCDCWGLVRRIFKEQYFIDLPSYDKYESTKELSRLSELIDSGRMREEWCQVERDIVDLGDVVLFQMQGQLCHVGFCLGNGRMLHIQKGKNSCIEDYNGLRWNKRVHSFYRHKSVLSQCSCEIAGES